jgi:hypothetical protein
MNGILTVKRHPLTMGHFAHVDAFTAPFAVLEVRTTYVTPRSVSSSISH